MYRILHPLSLHDALPTVEPAAVGAPHHRVGHRLRLEMLRPADHVGPFDRGVMVEPEAPMRCDAFGDRRIARLALVNRWQPARRSEEHTSELQSLMRISYAVFCLKKKTNNTNKNTE